jgi:proteic killer suppression protein
MIRSFATTETEQFYSTGKSRRFPPDILKRAAMCLPPSNKLEALAHDRAGQWSIRINPDIA